MANGKEPRERRPGAGKPGQKKSSEPVNLLIIEKEDGGLNSKSYNSMGSTGKGGSRGNHSNHVGAAGCHGYQGNGIIPNGPVAHPVTLVGTLTKNTASVSRGLPPLLEDDSNSASTANDDVVQEHSPTQSPAQRSPNVHAQESSSPSFKQTTSMENKMSYSKDGMTIRSNPLDNPFPSEDIIENVDNDARLKQNDLSSNNLESKVQNISRISPNAERKRTSNEEEIPDVLFSTPRKTQTADNRRYSGDDQVQAGKRPASISSIHNIPLENVNPQIKKFMDRVGFDSEVEAKTEDDRKSLNIIATDSESQTVPDGVNILPLHPKDPFLNEMKRNSHDNISEIPYSVVEAYHKGILIYSSSGTSANTTAKTTQHKSSPNNINEPYYAVVNKNKPKAKVANIELSNAKIENVERPEPHAKIIPRSKEPESPEKAGPPRSPNSIEFHRRMQKILEKQELEKQKRSPRREKRNITQPDHNSCPRFQQETSKQDQQREEDKNGQLKNAQMLKTQFDQAQSDIQHSVAIMKSNVPHSPTNLSQSVVPSQTSDSSPVPIDSGIYAKINPRKSPVLHKPQPVNYCKHCGSGHVTTGAPELPVSDQESVSEVVSACGTKDDIFKSIAGTQSPLPEHKSETTSPVASGGTSQYSWSDTTGTVIRAGARPKTSTTTLANSDVNRSVNASINYDQVSTKPPPAPNVSKSSTDQGSDIALSPPPPAAIARGKIAVTTAALLKQMHEEQQKLLQAQAGQGGAAAALDPTVILQQILLKQAVAHHHGRNVRRFSNPKVVYLGPDMEVTASKVSIYDNVQYVWKGDDHDPN